MTKTLLFKIFIWFCLTILLVLLSVLAANLLVRSGPPILYWQTETSQSLSYFGEMALETLESAGEPALINYCDKLRNATHIEPYLFDQSGVCLNVESPEESVKEAAQAASVVSEVRFFNHWRTGAGLSPMLAVPLKTRDSKNYVFVAILPHGPLDEFLSLIGVNIGRVLTILGTAFALCYFLAKYLTAPIEKLRIAAKKIAEGELDTRVGDSIGNRYHEIKELAQDFDIMAEKIQSLMNSQQLLLRDISHELRSPLTRLNVALELARIRSGDEAKSALDRIEHETERLNTLIQQLLTITRLESGVMRTEDKIINLTALIRKIVSDADFEAKGHSRGVVADIREDLFIQGTNELIRSAFENVIRNAIKYTKEGTSVDVTFQRETTIDGSWAVLRVRDHGPGVPEETLEKLFHPFYRVAESRDRKSGGTGVGLSITEKAIKLHNGTVTAENALDGGLIITIKLPVE